MTEPQRKSFLYVIVCAAGIAGDVGKLITAAQERGWEVVVVATPEGLNFLDSQVIENQTGYPICSAWRSPSDARSYPRADAIAVAPATFNTVNKWAAGFADNLALGIRIAPSDGRRLGAEAAERCVCGHRLVVAVALRCGFGAIGR
ncbi:flavoprotein [Streptomyces sp. NPDC059989]|uniref:flavoprotein n=1 Tax=Streptomyces sp. NPDC059989 TaxID=3347026 RepID=UPI003687C242